MTGMNPIEFNTGDLMQSIFTNDLYVLKSEKKGMAKLQNLDTGRLEDWNSCNNRHFKKPEVQLSLF